MRPAKTIKYTGAEHFPHHGIIAGHATKHQVETLSEFFRINKFELLNLTVKLLGLKFLKLLLSWSLNSAYNIIAAVSRNLSKFKPWELPTI